MTTCRALPADGCCISAGEGGKTEVYDKYPFVCLVGGCIRAIIIIITLRNKNTVLRKENQMKTKESI